VKVTNEEVKQESYKSIAKKVQKRKKPSFNKDLLIKIVAYEFLILFLITGISFLYSRYAFYEYQIQSKNQVIEIQEQIIQIYKEPQAQTIIENKTDLGQFKLTFYCACKKCCGPNAKGITATGTKVQEGRTIAVDPKVIKLGSQVEIEGFGTYIAEDTGSAIKGKIIDIYLNSHEEALHKGVQYANVYTKGGK
jgi:3D (Asp-Asp-Asp) domain-containing protein